MERSRVAAMALVFSMAGAASASADQVLSSAELDRVTAGEDAPEVDPVAQARLDAAAAALAARLMLLADRGEGDSEPPPTTPPTTGSQIRAILLAFLQQR